MSQIPRSRRPSPEVFRRRRIAAAVLLALFMALIWAGVNAVSSWLGGSSSTQLQLPDGMAESSVVVEAGEMCPPGTVVVESQVGNSSGQTMTAFAADETPHIWFTLTNTNSVDCTFNAGAKVQYFTIQSGDQDIWSSAQCARDTLEDGNIVLPAGETMASSPSPWEKVFSSDSGCGSEQAPVTTGGASYHLKVDVSGELSTNDQQFVLN
ncbi:unannotated protein [freshwater metagenome]|uniref:Unannotated protein n=1 Tax=freshwater metagenome TaxID=449393 RepID=A0A6J7FV22_9ZZZZ|nr:hypothetical protein [Actinomycetota bacterium]